MKEIIIIILILIGGMVFVNVVIGLNEEVEREYITCNDVNGVVIKENVGFLTSQKYCIYEDKKEVIGEFGIIGRK